MNEDAIREFLERGQRAQADVDRIIREVKTREPFPSFIPENEMLRYVTRRGTAEIREAVRRDDRLGAHDRELLMTYCDQVDRMVEIIHDAREADPA